MFKNGPCKEVVAQRPWTEAQWERFIADREQRPGAPLVAPPPPAEADFEFADSSNDLFGPAAELLGISAFRLISDLAEAIAPRLLAGGPLQSTWRRLLVSCERVAEGIALGHGLGYDDPHLCGNIVKCRQALKQLIRCAALLRRLRRRLPQDVGIRDLLGRALFARFALEERISSLRTRVWWE